MDRPEESGRGDVLGFRERLASVFTDLGVPRMAARVYAALFVSDSGRLTAAELAEELSASPAAISGAVRYLTRVGMATRHRDAGSRRDHFVVADETWQVMLSKRGTVMDYLLGCLRSGVDALGADTPAGARAAGTLSFLSFLQAELPSLVERWNQLHPRPPTA